MRAPTLALAPLAILLCACTDPVVPVDAGSDAGMADAYVDPPVVPDLHCPGSAGCEAGGDVQLQAGAAAVEITPTITETFTDTNMDGEWQPGDEPFDDADGDGRFDGQWIAGFGHARAAQGVMDPQWARAIVLRAGNTTLAMVALDCVGWMIEEIDPTRAMLESEGLDVDYLVVGATHVHQARDTVGIWGPSVGDTGLDMAYQAYVQERTIEAVRRALADLAPANVQYASVLLRDLDTPSDVNRYVGDNRHPNIIDDEIRILRFVEAGTATAEPGSGTTIATMVNFGSHPEFLGSSNTQLSSDFPHWMRTAIESGIDSGPDGTRVEGVGGIAIFWNGAIGAQIGPNRMHPRTWAGREIEEDTLEGATVVGTQLGNIVLEALRGDGTTIEDTAEIGFRRFRFDVTIQNRGYHIAGQQMLFHRSLFGYDTTRAIREPGNLPEVLTEIAVIDIGSATMLTIPGELDPAEFVGGYEAPCEYTPGGCDAMLFGGENLPDLTMAPEGPFLRDVLLEARPEATQVWALGVTNDFLGYFLPEFDYELDPGLPYIGEAPGQHYEETNSVGPWGWPRIREKMEDLIRWTE